MTVKTIVKLIRKEPSRIQAIRMTRQFTGLTFTSAKAMVDEVRANVSWYRNVGRERPW